MRSAGKKLRLWLIPLLLACAAPALTRADTATAEQEYKNGQWQKAAELFQAELVQSGQENNAALLYNLGAAYYRTGQMGIAYATLTKALRLNPFDSDTSHNWRLVRERMPAATLEFMPDSWFTWLPWSLRLLPAGIWLSVFLAGMIFMLYNYDRKKLRKRDRNIAAAICSIAFLIFGLLQFEQRLPWAAAREDTTMRSGPENTFPEITKIPSGALFNIEETRDGWCKIRLQIRGESSVGWLEATKLFRIQG